MSSKRLPFILAEEMKRAEGASSYEAYILKSHIENIITQRKVVEKNRKNLCCGSMFTYFDKDMMVEDTIQINSINEDSVTGMRQSDNKEATVPIDSLLLTQAITMNDEKRREFKEDWLLKPFTRVVMYQNVQQSIGTDGRLMLLGYLIKWGHNTHTLKLLGGELIHLRCTLLQPTEADLEIFERYENDKHILQIELERTRQLAIEKGSGLDLDSDIDARKLVRLLTTRGCRKENIQVCLAELKNASLDLVV